MNGSSPATSAAAALQLLEECEAQIQGTLDAIHDHLDDGITHRDFREMLGSRLIQGHQVGLIDALESLAQIEEQASRLICLVRAAFTVEEGTIVMFSGFFAPQVTDSLTVYERRMARFNRLTA